MFSFYQPEVSIFSAAISNTTFLTIFENSGELQLTQNSIKSLALSAVYGS